MAQRQSVFERIMKNDLGPKAWAENDLQRLISSMVAGKAITHMLRDLVRKSLGEQSGPPFTQRITDAALPKKFLTPKFNIYNE